MTSPSIACDSSDPRPESAADKGLLRIALLAARQHLSLAERAASDAAIGAQVMAWVNRGGDAGELSDPMSIVGVYWPIRNEPDLRPAYAALSAQGVQLALPVVVAKDAPLQFIRWLPGTPMTKDSFGLAIPLSGEPVLPHALLVPCVGFNRQRLRLGYGGGFYDRTLACQPRPRTVGIAYAAGLVAFDGAAHDVALERIFTENGEC